jgi:alpha-mannosidase
MNGIAAATIHVVPHTHWDREWYLPAARFRQQLVALVDELLDDPPAPGSSFLLDGQMVVFDDYVDVRPERAERLRALIADGRIEAGPWYVLADELIPGGEALVRNLLAGRRALARIGASAPPVLYCPDSFGHPAALPSLAAGFGLGLIILSRGFGSVRWPAADFTRWSAPGGDHAVLYHLSRKGYDIGENLPSDPEAARERWTSLRVDLLGRAKLGVALLPNGADHHARQADLSGALRALAAAARPADVRGSSLAAFARDAIARASAASLDDVRGELRDSYGFTWTLQGTFATRAHQKRRNAHAERLLVRDAEPWAELARRRGAATRAPLVNAAWRSVLLCHPHDTLCGCSTDEVARAMDARLDEAVAQGDGIRTDAVYDLIGHDPNAARERRRSWAPMAVVRNAAPRPRSGVAIIRLTSFASDVKVGANASPGPVETSKATTPALHEVAAQQVLDRRLEHERTEAPRHYPDVDLVQVTDVAAWIPEVPACGIRCFAHQVRSRRMDPPNPARAAGTSISNGLVTVAVDAGGRVSFTDVASGRAVADVLRWDSATDRGDLYTASIRAPRFAAEFKGAKLLHKGPVRAAVETRWSFGGAKERITAAVTFVVDANAPFVRVVVAGDNGARDHRLRIGFATDVSQARVFADAMFGPVERHPIVVSDAEAAMEIPPATAPLHRYVSLFTEARGATVFSDGLGEYEATDDGRVLVTLVRSVDELSRNDMPERSGHAGWPTHTPEAQCVGPFGAELALMFHASRSTTTLDAIERAADDVLLPLAGATLRSALANPGVVPGAELSGTGLSCPSITGSEDGVWTVLRCVNVTDEPQRGAWRIGPVVEAWMSRLDQTPGDALSTAGGRIEFVAGPHAVVTILAR